MQHFVNFAYDRATGEGFGATKNSFGTQSQTGKDAQWLMKNDREGYEEYKKQAQALWNDSCTSERKV
jgi:hypothetical protein